MKTILMVIPFDNIYPPMNGGMLRCFNLLNQLCRNYKVTTLMRQDKHSFMKAVTEFPSIKNCDVLSTKDNKVNDGLFSLIPSRYRNAIKFRIWNRSLTETADGNYLQLYPQMKNFLENNSVDYVILEDMSILTLSKLVKRYRPGTPIIYDAYNVNTILSQALFEKKEISEKDFETTKKVETSIFKFVDKIFACSELDLDELKRMNKGFISGTVIPNGVGIPARNENVYEREGKSSLDILFCGSLDYFPNREGLLWFLKHVFQLILDQLPNARLLVVGKGDPGNELLQMLDHASIINHGRVERVDIYYKKAALAVVPLLSGSGTRLKLLEAMAYGSPVVSTSSGAEGIDYIDEKNILIADEPALFAKKVIELLKNPTRATEIANEAFSFVEKNYDWNIIGKKMSDYLNNIKV